MIRPPRKSSVIVARRRAEGQCFAVIACAAFSQITMVCCALAAPQDHPRPAHSHQIVELALQRSECLWLQLAPPAATTKRTFFASQAMVHRHAPGALTLRALRHSQQQHRARRRAYPVRASTRAHRSLRTLALQVSTDTEVVDGRPRRRDFWSMGPCCERRSAMPQKPLRPPGTGGGGTCPCWFSRPCNASKLLTCSTFAVTSFGLSSQTLGKRY